MNRWHLLSLGVLPAVLTLTTWHHFGQPWRGFWTGLEMAVTLWLIWEAYWWVVKRFKPSEPPTVKAPGHASKAREMS
jgi:hypothetical protein